MLVDEGLELLDDGEAWALLERCRVGRVGLTIGGLPAIFPVNYAVIDGTIVFRTAPGSKLAAASRGTVVAFEVDEANAVDRSGWSVLAIGPSEVVHDLGLTCKVLRAGLEPWAEGQRPHLVRITPSILSGRRIVHPEERAEVVSAGRLVSRHWGAAALHMRPA